MEPMINSDGEVVPMSDLPISAAPTRRSFLSALPGFAAASTVFAAGDGGNVAFAAADSPAPQQTAVPQVDENPDLIAAHVQLRAAAAEVTNANDALLWLADEWKHRWPEAPEEILLGAHAERGYGKDKDAERDIIGRYVIRDTSDLTKRFSAKSRRETPQTCFTLLTADDAMKTIDGWNTHTPKGRTENALFRNRAYKEKALQEYRQKYTLALNYEAETAQLREVSGVADRKQKLVDARRRLWDVAEAISYLRADTIAGLQMKIEAIRAHAGSMLEMTEGPGPFHQISRLMASIASINVRGDA